MKTGNKQRGIIALIVMLIFSVAIIFGTNFITNFIDKIQENPDNLPATVLADGTYHAERTDDTGTRSYVDMEVKKGLISSVVWDEIDADGNKKTVLAMEGKYVMTETGPNWAEQAKALADYVIDNQSAEGITVNGEGKTDTVAGVSISVTDFIELANECIMKAAGQQLYKDGTYHSEIANEGGGKAYVDMVVKGGGITSVVWDEIDADGNKKTVLAMEGKYVMTETGPNWAEQAKAMADYVIEHQSADGIKLNEEGKTDTVATVSISVKNFVTMTEDCIKQAKNVKDQISGLYKDGTYHSEIANEGGGKSYVDMVVKGGGITSVVWDEIDADGNKKTVLAMEGKYVMTETGPNWAEQAKAMADYIIDHQSADGIKLNEEGKTDTVATVSISVKDFVTMAEDCIKQAKNVKDQISGLYKDGTYHSEIANEGGGKAYVDMVVKGGGITSVVWDEIDVDGNKKTVLAMEGKYVMTETGPNWAEQAKAMADYVIEHQSADGIKLNEEGKTDTVATVSISVKDFVTMTEDCIKQAKG